MISNRKRTTGELTSIHIALSLKICWLVIMASVKHLLISSQDAVGYAT